MQFRQGHWECVQLLSILLTLQEWRDEFMSNSWFLARAAPALPCPWCSQCQWRGKPPVEGVRSDLPGRNADGFGVKAECSRKVSLERGMSWSTSGSVSGSFPKEEWKGWSPARAGWSLSYLHTKSCLCLPFLAVVEYTQLK